MTHRLQDEPGDLILDRSQDLAGRRPSRRPVTDHRTRVAHEVGQRQDAPPVQLGGAVRGVRRVRGGRDDTHTRRQSPRHSTVDHPRPGPRNQHVGRHLREQSGRRTDWPAVASNARVAVRAAQREQYLDIQSRGVRDVPGQGRHRDHPAATADYLASHPAAHLAESLDRDRTPFPAPPPLSAQRHIGGDRDSITGQQILERHAAHGGGDGGRRGPARAQRSEVLLGRAHVRPGQEPARPDHRPDLRAVPGHQAGLAASIRRVPAHPRLGTADPLTQHGELIGHRSRQQRHLGHADIRNQPRAPGGHQRARQIEHHNTRDRAQLDDLRAAVAMAHMITMTQLRSG